MTREISYTLMLANEGGMQIMGNGERFICTTDTTLAKFLGDDILNRLKDDAIQDAKITVKIETK